MNLLWIICRLRGHLYRRHRKHEDAALKYCTRCGASAAVRRRVK